MTAYGSILATMKAQKPFSCTYSGLYREVCAHTLGRKNGREQVLVFQYAGESSKGLPPEGEWRCMPVVGIENFHELDGPWRTGTRQGNPQTCVDDVDFEVFG